MKANNILVLIVIMTVTFFGLACAQTGSNGQKDPAKTEIQTNKYQDLTAEQFKARMANKDVVILDIRTNEEIAAGKIEGAIQIDFRASDFNSKIDALDKSKEYLVYCAAAGRSTKACKTMQKKGFTNVGNLLGGYGAWPYK
ncbi:rhodanese-like domain-containing protein [Saprospiraceae bacterium]|nr:rhodanese-like domain-containing protein [Saprospiraceae bacterium]